MSAVLTLGEIRKGIALLPEGRRRAQFQQWFEEVLESWLLVEELERETGFEPATQHGTWASTKHISFRHSLFNSCAVNVYTDTLAVINCYGV